MAEIDDWLEMDYEDRNGGAYDPQDDPRAEEYMTYDGPDGCTNCGGGVGEPDENGLCFTCADALARHEAHVDQQIAEREVWLSTTYDD